jgi:hypothetical protein
MTGSTRKSSVPLRARRNLGAKAQEGAFGQSGGETDRPIVDFGNLVALTAGNGGGRPRGLGLCEADRLVVVEG